MTSFGIFANRRDPFDFDKVSNMGIIWLVLDPDESEHSVYRFAIGYRALFNRIELVMTAPAPISLSTIPVPLVKRSQPQFLCAPLG